MISFNNILIQEHQSPLAYQDFCEQFAQLNQFLHLGTGYFSKAYGNKKSPYVYKVGLMTSHYQKDPYLVYLSKGNKNNSLFPKIRTVTIFQHKNTSFYVVEMEKLHDLSDKKLTTNSLAIKQEFVTFYNDYAMFKRPSHKLQTKFLMSLKNKFPKHQSLQQSIDLFSSLFKQFCYDVHASNMMMRSNGQLVITDPVCKLGDVVPIVF